MFIRLKNVLLLTCPIQKTISMVNGNKPFLIHEPMPIFTSSGRSRGSGSGCLHDGCPNSSFILQIVSCLTVGNDVLAGSDVVTIIPCDCRDLSPATPGDSPAYTESTEITFTTRASFVSFCGVIMCVTRCSVTSTSTQLNGLRYRRILKL